MHFVFSLREVGQWGGKNGGREREERGENQLRRRRPQTGEPEPGEGGVEEVGEEGEGEGRRGEGVVEGEPVKDPLKWFGVLVLRICDSHSKTSFKVSSTMSCDYNYTLLGCVACHVDTMFLYSKNDNI